MLLRNGSSDRMGKGSFGLIGKNHFIFVYNPNKKQTLILVGIVMWLKTYFRHGFQNLTTNKDTWQISKKNSNNTRYKKWKWEWIRHILQKGNANIIYQTLQVKRLKWQTDSKKIFFWRRNWKLKKKTKFHHTEGFTLQTSSPISLQTLMQKLYMKTNRVLFWTLNLVSCVCDYYLQIVTLELTQIEKNLSLKLFGVCD